MKRALQAAGIVALLAFVWAAIAVANAARSIAKSVNQVDRSVAVVAKSTNDILTNVRQAVDAHKADAEAQGSYWLSVRDRTTRILDHADHAVADLDAMIKRTDENVNASLLPEAADALKTTNGALETTATSVALLSADSHRTLTASGETMESLAKLVADPNIPRAMENANSSMRDFNDTMHNVKETSDEARAWAHKAMTPASLARRAAVFTWNSMLSFLGAFARAGT